MRPVERSKVRCGAIAPSAAALLDFRRGPAPELGLYGVFFLPEGAVSLDAFANETAFDAHVAGLGVARVELPPWLEPLEELAAGEPVDVAEVPAVIEGPPFFARVWRALREVRRGDVCTYQQLARRAGSPRAMRAVGQAMARNPLPLVVPCHRVIALGARIGGYTGGLARKRALLALEGVEVRGDLVEPRQLELEPIARRA